MHSLRSTPRCLLALATCLLSAPRAAAQDAPAPGGWRVAPGARFTLEWRYSLEERIKSTTDGERLRQDVREVTALLVAEEAVGERGALRLDLEKVRWRVVDRFGVLLTWEAGASAPEVALDEGVGIDAEAKAKAEEMRAYVGSRHRLMVRPGETAVQVEREGGRWAGGPDAATVLNKLYLHSPLPDEPGKTRKWTCPRAAEYLPMFEQPGHDEEYPKVELKVIRAGSGLLARGSGKVKFKGRTMEEWAYVGQSTIERTFEFADAGHLATSTEEAVSKVKRDDLLHKGTSERGELTITQTLTITPRP